MTDDPFKKRIQTLLGHFLNENQFSELDYVGSAMGEKWVQFSNSEFYLEVDRQRCGSESISIGCRLPSSGKLGRNSWSLGHIRGYLDGQVKQFSFSTLESQIEWLELNKERIFDPELLYSKELKTWSKKAANLMFGV